MKLISFSLASLVLVGGLYAAQVQKLPSPHQHMSADHHSDDLLHTPGHRIKKDALSKDLTKNESVKMETDKKLVHQEVEKYTTIVKKLESAKGKIPETIKAHYRDYKEALEKLMKDIERNPQINIKAELFFITQKHNMFSGGY